MGNSLGWLETRVARLLFWLLLCGARSLFLPGSSSLGLRAQEVGAHALGGLGLGSRDTLGTRYVAARYGLVWSSLVWPSLVRSSLLGVLVWSGLVWSSLQSSLYSSLQSRRSASLYRIRIVPPAASIAF